MSSDQAVVTTTVRLLFDVERPSNRSCNRLLDRHRSQSRIITVERDTMRLLALGDGRRVAWPRSLLRNNSDVYARVVINDKRASDATRRGEDIKAFAKISGRKGDGLKQSVRRCLCRRQTEHTRPAYIPPRFLFSLITLRASWRRSVL